MTYAVRITRSSGEQTMHPLVAPETTVGSDASADVRVVGEASILPQHILLAPRREQCWVSTAPGAPLWDKHGVAVEGAYVPWGTRLTVGHCALELVEESGGVNMKSSRNSVAPETDKASESDGPVKERIHPGFLMLLVVTLAFAVLRGLTFGASPTATGLTEAPALFEDGPLPCRGENPRHRASALEEQALAKSERSVFDLQDGIEAVALYLEAHRCYLESGQIAESEYVLFAGDALRATLEEQYDLLRLRLSRDLSANNQTSAQLQVRRLSELLRHKADTKYALALRRLSARLSKQGSNL